MPFHYKMANVTFLDKAELLQSQTAQFISLYFSEYYCPPSAH